MTSVLATDARLEVAPDASGEAPDSPERANRDLALARQQLEVALNHVERDLHNALDWRAFVRRHPLAAAGSAALVGYAVGRLFRRRP
jgi:ElaB/YqjD/DUF883 family membrane-anchored ribosome-binding protein